MKRFSLLLALLVLAALPAQAQFHVGAHGGYDFEVERGLVGITTHFGLPNTSLVLAPSVDYFLGMDNRAEVDGVDLEIEQTLVAFNLEALYLFGIDNQVFTPYAGVGIGLLYSRLDDEANDLFPALEVDNSATDFGVNLTGGAIFGAGSLRPFAAVRARLTGESLTSVMGGVMFTF